MSRKILTLAAIILVFWACQVQAEQITCRWVGGEHGCWCEAGNWDCGTVPDNGGGNTFVVIIDSSAFGVEGVDVGLTRSRTIDQLDCNGLELEKWTSNWVSLTLKDSNGLTNHGQLWCSELEINGNVTNKGGSYMFLSDMEIEDGNLYNEANAKLEIELMVDVDPGSFINNGWVFIIPASEFWIDGGSFTNNGTIQIKNGLVGNGEDAGVIHDFVNTSSGIIWGSGDILSEANVVNGGSITASSGVLVVYADEQIFNTGTGTLESKIGSSLHLEMGVADFNNLGQIKVKANGAVTVKSGGIFKEPSVCTLNNEPNGIIKLYGGSLAAGSIVQKADANFTGFGSITGDVFIEPGGVIKLTGPTNIVGDVNIPAGATLEISDGQTLITGFTDCKGTIRLIGGTVVFQGGCDCDECNITHEPGTDRNHFDINGDGTVDLRDFAGFADIWLWRASWY